MTTKELLGSRIREARKLRGMTQHDLEKKASIAENQVSQYEHGVHIPSVESLLRIADILDVSMDYLSGRKMIDKHGRTWEMTTVRENNDKPRSFDDDFAEANRCYAKLPTDE